MLSLEWKNITLYVFLIILSSYTHVCFCASPLSVCITNCVQCKQMFGHYFQGRACGDACMATGGLITPDCNNPVTMSAMNIFYKNYGGFNAV